MTRYSSNSGISRNSGVRCSVNSGLNRGLASTASTTSGASHSADEEDDAPVVDPEYGDLLDAKWLERGTDALDPEDDLVDIGLTIDLDGGDDADDLAQMLDLDVGTLLTSLPEEDADIAVPDIVATELGASDMASIEGAALDRAADTAALDRAALDRAERADGEHGDGSVGIGVLRGLLLPEERDGHRRDEDEAIGDDERFPVFEGVSASDPSAPLDDDAEGPSEG
jgi:hypothetical protein